MHKKLARIGVTTGMFVAAGFAFYGAKRLSLDVTFERVPVVSIQQVPGGEMSDRLVIVDLGDRRRAIRTSDRLLMVEAGQLACIAKRTFLLRRWKHYSLELPGYCRRG